MITKSRVVISLLLAAAGGFLVFAIQQTRDPDKKVAIFNSAVKEVFPASGDLDLRQSVIGFQLQTTYTGRLEVDGTAIPDDEIFFQPGLNRFTWDPGRHTETLTMRPGRHTATALFWPIGDTEAHAGQSFNWTFTLH